MTYFFEKLKNAQFVCMEIEVLGEKVLFNEKIFETYNLAWCPSFFTKEAKYGYPEALDLWCRGEYLDDLCTKFGVEFNDDYDWFVISFKKDRDLMKCLRRMMRFIRFLMEENKKHGEHAR